MFHKSCINELILFWSLNHVRSLTSHSKLFHEQPTHNLIPSNGPSLGLIPGFFYFPVRNHGIYGKDACWEFHSELGISEIHPKYAFSAIANLDWEITKIIFRVNFGIFDILKNPRIQPERYRNSP